ncbi:MAG: PorT family protein [Cyclobacteriaceae bacterium]|nr:PorT family protein [Cyclobacteriaceae bacterium]
MKFYSGLAIALFLIVGTVRAQHANFGVKGGLNLYNIENDNNAKYDTKTAFHLGMLLHIHMAPHFAVQPELLYSVQGATYNTGNGKVNLNLEYANVPFMFQYMFDNGFRLEAGPQVGFLINAKSELNGSDTDIKDSIKKIDFAIGAGIGYIHPPSGWGVDARYNYGLSNINENGSVNSYNRGFQLGVLYQFQHK